MSVEIVRHAVVKCLTTVTLKNVVTIWWFHMVVALLVVAEGSALIFEVTNSVMVQEENDCYTFIKLMQ